MLEVKNINKLYKGTPLLKDISFSCEAGNVIGLIGNNGAGKTTLLRILCGLIEADSGEVVLDRVASTENYKEYISKIGCCLNLNAGYKNQTAYQNLKYIAKLKGNYDEEQIEDMLNLVNLENEKKVKEFSLGMKARLNIAMALIGTPQVLVLDEPLNGLDPDGIAIVRNVILRMAKEEKKLVLVSSHILSELEQTADTILVIEKGELVSEIKNFHHENCKLEDLFYDAIRK